MIGRLCLALAMAAPAAAGSNETVVTMKAGRETPVAQSPNDAIVVALIAGYGKKAQGAELVWKKYDPSTGAVQMMRPKGDNGVSTLRLYYKSMASSDTKGDYTVFFGVVPAGDYVLAAEIRGPLKITQFCQGAPVMHVAAGSVTYLGSYRVYSDVAIEGSNDHRALGWEGDIAKAKEALSSTPALKERLVSADIRNGAAFDCVGGSLSRRTAYEIPGMPKIAR